MMRNRILLLLLTILIIGRASAQVGAVSGKLVDSVSHQNLKDATVSILNPADSSLIVYSLSKQDGSFSLPNVPYGSHLMYITFQGYLEVEKRFTLSAETSEFNAGTIFLSSLPANLGTVTVRTSPIVIKGDTTEFNASMFATKPNSTAEDLLKKMPGMEVEKDGSIKAQGQTVTRVMVDGKRFFGDDPTLATRNLPSDMIDKIQLVDAQSDQSAFSGFDDGNRQMTINIVTKKDRRKGVFGKAALGGGDDLSLNGDPRYAANTNISLMNGNRQISFIGQANNNNNQNFSSQDILGTGGAAGGGNFGGGGQRGGGNGGGQRGGGNNGPSNFGGGFSTGPTGFTKTLAGGINYSDVWSPKVSVNGSYFYNNQNRILNQDKFRETFVTGDSSRFTTSTSLQNNKNINNRFNYEIEYKLDTANSIQFRPTYQQQQTNNYNESSSFTTRGMSSLQSDVYTNTTTQTKGYSSNNSLLFRHKFAKRGRTLSLNLTQSLNTNDAERRTLSYNNSYQNGFASHDTTNQILNTNRDGKSYGASVSYTEPVGIKGLIELNYNYNYNENTSDQKTMQYNKITSKYDIQNLLLSNDFENTNTSNRLSLNYRKQINRFFNYTVGLGVQNSALTSSNKTKNTYYSPTYNNFTPTFMLQYRKDRSMNIRLNYRGATNQPSVTQLQDVIDNSNPLYITTGNPNLKQEFAHNINLILTKFDVVTFKNLVVSINGSMTANSIGNQIFQNVDSFSVTLDNKIILLPNAQFVRPINRNGGYNMSGFFLYGFPLKNPKSNVSLTTNITYNRSVNTITNVSRSNFSISAPAAPSYTNSYVFGETIRYNMNLKERMDLNFSSRSTYNMSRYGEQTKTTTATSNSDYFTEVVSVEPTYSTKSGFIVASDLDYNLSRGQAAGYNQSFAMWNASLAQLLFKKKQGEIRFTVYDLLNQNRSITRSAQANYIEDTRTDVLRRYFMLTFTYNIRKFGGNQQQNNGGNNPMRQMFRGGGGMNMRPPNQ